MQNRWICSRKSDECINSGEMSCNEFTNWKLMNIVQLIWYIFFLLKKGLIFLDKRKKRDIEDLMKNYSNHIRPEGNRIWETTLRQRKKCEEKREIWYDEQRGAWSQRTRKAEWAWYYIHVGCYMIRNHYRYLDKKNPSKSLNPSFQSQNFKVFKSVDFQ